MGKDKTIYLVNDNQDDAILSRSTLESIIKEASITQVADLNALFDLLGKQGTYQEPTLIIMQVNLSDQPGLWALSSLKLNPQTQYIPIVVISPSPDQQLIRYSYDEGISALIAKPASVRGYEMIAEEVKLCFMNDSSSVGNLPAPQNFTGKSILVIEDDADQWELMSCSLKRNIPDLNVIRRNGKESTLDFLTDEWNIIKPELIISDLYLPTRQAGLSLLDSIRYFFLFHGLPTVPIITFSSSDHQQDIRASYQHRANAYMVKPLNANETFSSLKNLCHFWWDTVILPTI